MANWTGRHVDVHVLRVLARIGFPGYLEGAARRRRDNGGVAAAAQRGEIGAFLSTLEDNAKRSELVYGLQMIGKTVCTHAALPRCDGCPVRNLCRYAAAEQPSASPPPIEVQPPVLAVDVAKTGALLVRGKAVAVVRPYKALGGRGPADGSFTPPISYFSVFTQEAGTPAAAKEPTLDDIEDLAGPPVPRYVVPTRKVATTAAKLSAARLQQLWRGELVFTSQVIQGKDGSVRPFNDAEAREIGVCERETARVRPRT